MWCHFRQVGVATYVIININAESREFGFTTVKRKELRDFGEKFAICVMDGVRQDNRGDINALAEDLEYDRNIWVSSHQLTIPKEQLRELGWTLFNCSSWTSDEIDAYAATFDVIAQAATKTDFINAMSDMSSDPNNHTFEEIIGIKKWFFGGSARYMFGLEMKESLSDLEEHVKKINDVEKVFQGLAGSRGILSVNHIIAYFPGAGMESPLLSPYVIELLSKQLGFAAIRMFYRSSWVRENPSVHGFVFEWDLLMQVQQYGHLRLSSTSGDAMDVIWTVEKNISLKNFLKGKNTKGSIMVHTEKWNNPEYNVLYIHTNDQEERELVAWNASVATTHSGNVAKLQGLLREIGNRVENPLVFDKVRIVFIVPTEKLGVFTLPNNLLAKILTPWKFNGFEVLGCKRTTDSSH